MAYRFAILAAFLLTAMLVAFHSAAMQRRDRGDLNYDGRVDFQDIGPFSLALIDPQEWQRRYGRSSRELLDVGDFDVDGEIGSSDIHGFGATVARATGGSGSASAGPNPPPGIVDLDVDSDNNDGTDLPERSDFEDGIEDNLDETGKFVLVNDDDDDRDGNPDKDQNGSIPAERDDLVPLVLEITPGGDVQPLDYLNYRLSYPINVRLWRSATRGDLSSDVVISGTSYSQQVWILGDMNGDGAFDAFDIEPFLLALFDPDEYALQYPTIDPVLVGDMNGDGVLDSFDIEPFNEALASGEKSYVPVRMWIEGLTPSAVQADTRLVAESDTDDDGSFESEDAVRTTVFSLSRWPSSGILGAAIVFTLEPAVPPVAFTPTTTANWSGVFTGVDTGATVPFEVQYDSATVHELSTSAALLILGEGQIVSGVPSYPGLEGAWDGDLTLHFSGLDVTRAVPFTLDKSYTYVHGVQGAGAEVSEIWILDPSNPYWGEALTLELAKAGHFLLAVLADKNVYTVPVAPNALLIELVSKDAAGLEIDRLPLTVYLETEREDLGSTRLVYYSDWEKPLVFVSSPVDPGLHPTLNILLVDPDGVQYPVFDTSP